MKRLMFIAIFIALAVSAASSGSPSIVRICAESGMYATRNCPHTIIMQEPLGVGRLMVMCPLHPTPEYEKQPIKENEIREPVLRPWFQRLLSRINEPRNRPGR